MFSLGFGTPDTYEDKKNSNYWRFILFVPILIAILQSTLLLIFFKFETPIFSLISKNDEVEAKQVLSINTVALIKYRKNIL